MIDIRRCRSDEVGAVMDFIGAHWRAGHVLATSRALMDWQHGDGPDGYTYLCAWRGGELAGVLGYIPSRRYDPALAGDNILWLALWKVREDSGVTGLGLRMLDSLARLEPNAGIAVNGINPAHPPMYRAMRWQVGELRQFYAVDPTAPQTLIAAPRGFALPVLGGGDATVTDVDSDRLSAMDPTRFAAAVPRKTPMHFVGRFLGHPFYRYRVAVVEAPGGGPALIAFRLAEHAGGRALRIVDFLGDAATFARAGHALLGLVRAHGAQYADFCQFGLPDDALAGAGLAPAEPDGAVLVPTYFEPFVAKTGRIFCAIKPREAGRVVICRADGDQDRPNLLPGGTP